MELTILSPLSFIKRRILMHHGRVEYYNCSKCSVLIFHHTHKRKRICTLFLLYKQQVNKHVSLGFLEKLSTSLSTRPITRRTKPAINCGILEVVPLIYISSYLKGKSTSRWVTLPAFSSTTLYQGLW